MNSQKINFNDLQSSDLSRADSQEYAKNFAKGLNKKLVHKISEDKKEPEWLLNIRLKALEKFQSMPLPTWGPDLSGLDFENIRYFSKASENNHAQSWEDVNPEIKQTFERLKIPEAERTVLAGVGAQYESENVYHRLKSEWE